MDKEMTHVYNESPSSENLRTVEQDYIDLFTHARKGHMGKYVYMHRPFIYEEILKQESYYPFHMESQLLKEISSTINQYVPGVRHVLEIGPGSRTAVASKTIPFLKGLGERGDISSYIAIDATLDYSRDACTLVKNHFSWVKTEGLEVDFLSPHAFDGIKKASPPHHKTLLIAFGQPIFSNNTEEDIKVLLKNIGDFLAPGDYVLFGLDTNQDEILLEKAYNTDLIYELLLNCMYFLKNTIFLPFLNPSAFDYVYRWNDQSHTVELNLKATQDQEMTIGRTPISIKVSQEFNILNSWKPSIDKIQPFLDQENLVIRQVLSSQKNHTNTLAMVILERKGKI